MEMIILLVQQRFKINVVMFFMTAFVFFHPFSVLANEEKASFVEFPSLDLLGDSNLDESQVLESDPNKTVDPAVHLCDGFVSAAHFEKKEDLNQHPGFPLVPSAPMIGDQLNVAFFKDISSQKFFVEHWPSDHFPLATFHLETNDEKFRSLVQKVFDYINRRSIEEKLIPKNTLLVELSKKTISANQIFCGSNIIHINENKNNFSGYTQSSVQYENSARLGEILNKDLRINIPDFDSWAKNFFNRQTAARAYNEQFYHEILHELLHALGLVHNFALGSIMDYEGQSYSDRVNPGSKKLYREYDSSLRYEMEVLAFLYGHSYQKSKITWPVIRSTNAGTFYFVDDEPREWGINEDGQYKGMVDVKKSRLFCEDRMHQAFDVTDSISDKFDISLTLINDEDVELVPYGESSWVKVSIKNVVSTLSAELKNSVFTFNVLMRNLPGIYFRNVKGRVTSSAYTDRLSTSRLVLKHTSSFLDAFSNDKNSIVDTYFHIPKSEMFCHLQLQFEILNQK